MAPDPQLPTPREIRKQAGKILRITWTDGHGSEFTAHDLRGRCPCAMCVDEMSGQRRVGAPDVSPTVEMLEVSLVGNYAVHVNWSDGHRTGIYSFDYLRRICPCEGCTSAP